MNNIYHINNSRYSFKIGITNSNNQGVVIPLDKSCIEALVIEDTLSFIGYRGYITIANFYGVMQKFESISLMNGYNILVIDIENLDPVTINAKPLRLKLECLLGEAVESNDNVVNRSVTINFEELIVGLLRTKYFSVDQLNNLGAATATDYIQQVVRVGLGIEDTNSAFANIDFTCTPAPIGGIFTKSQSCYDLLRFFYRNCYYEDGIPSIITTVPVEEGDNLVHKFSIKNLGAYFSGFFNKLINSAGAKTIDLREYLMETFISGSTYQSDTFGDNFIDKYELYRPDYLDILSTKWVDYNITPNLDFTGVSSGDIFKYEDARKMFEYKILGKTYKSNLPPPPPAEALNNALITTAPVVREWKDSIKATVMKSFIFDNTAIVFTVKGLPHRQAGYFVNIVLENKEEQKKVSQDMNGFYYVISVKHLFKKDAFVNEIVAVKVYLNQDTLSPFALDAIQNSTAYNEIDLGASSSTAIPVALPSNLFLNFALKRTNFIGSNSKLSSDEPGER